MQSDMPTMQCMSGGHSRSWLQRPMLEAIFTLYLLNDGIAVISEKYISTHWEEGRQKEGMDKGNEESKNDEMKEDIEQGRKEGRKEGRERGKERKRKEESERKGKKGRKEAK